MRPSDRSLQSTEVEGSLAAGGTDFFYRTIGVGRPVVILHGGPGLGHPYLRPAMDELADGFRLIYWDQRGSGRTPVGDAERMNLAGAVEDVRAVVDGLAPGRANLLGHSYGADLAALFAASYPDRIGSLVLANPGPPFDRDGMEALGSEMQRRRSARENAALGQIQESAAFQQREPQAVEEYIRNLYLPFFNDPAAASSLNLEFSEHSAATVVEGEETFFEDVGYTSAAMTRLERVSAPTLVLYADRDPIPERFARSLADRIPGARYAHLAAASHFAYLETPETFFGAVRPFLEAEAGAADA